MSYTLTLHHHPGYLHAIVTGQNSPENVMSYLEQLVQECAARNCWRVLVEERLEGPRLGAAEVFRIASQGSIRHPGRIQAMAYVDVYAEADLMKFAEDVAVNRAFPVRVFSTVDEAEQWLRHGVPR